MTIINDADDLESLKIEADRLERFYFETIQGDYDREKETASDPIYTELQIARYAIAKLKYPNYPNHSELEAKLVEKEEQNQEDEEFNAFVNNGEQVGPPLDVSIDEAIENEQTGEINESPINNS